MTSPDERRLEKLEEEIGGKAPPEDEEKSPLAEMIENNPELRQAYREFRKAKQRGQEPDQEYVDRIRKAQEKAEELNNG